MLTTRTEVFVNDLRIEAMVGILPHEIGTTQPVVLDVLLEVDTVEGDDIATATDYRAVKSHAEALGRQQFSLIETFAGELAARLLNNPRVRTARVSMTKPRALDNARAGVTVKLERVGVDATTRGTRRQEDHVHS